MPKSAQKLHILCYRFGGSELVQVKSDTAEPWTELSTMALNWTWTELNLGSVQEVQVRTLVLGLNFGNPIHNGMWIMLNHIRARHRIRYNDTSSLQEIILYYV